MRNYLNQLEINAFNAYAEHTQNITPREDYLEKAWFPHKQDLIKLLQNNLILEKEISVEMTKVLRAKVYKQFIQDIHTFKQNIWYILQMTEEFSSSEITSYKFYYCLFDEETIFNNTMPKKYSLKELTLTHIATGKKLKIEIGKTKLARIFNFIVKYANYTPSYGDPSLAAQYEDFRLKQSKLIQHNKFTGTMCLSVHPLDFATMSDNEESWTSCMSWRESGCYRAGTLEMMTSPIVLLAYIKSNNNTIHFEGDDGAEYSWNSKIWRTLIIVNENIITEVKSYPFYDSNLSKAAIEWVAELSGSSFDTPLLSNEEYQGDHSLTFENVKPKFIFSTNLMYNDVGYQSYYFAKLSKEFYEEMEYPRYYIDYGDQVYCLKCGQEMDITHGLVCNECGDYPHCSCCGETLDTNRDDLYYSAEGNVYCTSCWENNSSRCGWCEEWYLNEDTCEISFTHKDETLYVKMCKDCYESMVRNGRIVGDEVNPKAMSMEDFKELFREELEDLFNTQDEIEEYLSDIEFFKNE